MITKYAKTTKKAIGTNKHTQANDAKQTTTSDKQNVLLENSNTI